VEPWAAQLLALLNTEIREPQANRYITPALDELQEIQRTGDIFFPGDWLYCLLSGHKSEEAKQLVLSWIAAHHAYPVALMNKLKENAYFLLRSE
jgi:aminopeptidase N